MANLHRYWMYQWLLRRALRRERLFRNHMDPLEQYNDDELLSKFRFTRDGLQHVCALIQHELVHPTYRSHALTPMQQLCIALRFYAGGAFLQTCGDTLGVSMASASRAVTAVTEALCSIARQHIVLPRTAREVNKIKDDFFNMAGFPNVTGCIDGTHIRIQAPAQFEQEYVNRKNYHSLNIQVLVDSQQLFTNVVSQWPGSVHDSRILRLSALFRLYESGRGEGTILGDSGYPCRVWLMTPYTQPQNRHEQAFNIAHTLTRVKVEQTIGTLKRIFACLHNEMRFTPDKVTRVVLACCTLHNIRKRLQMPDPDDDEGDGGDGGDPGVNVNGGFRGAADDEGDDRHNGFAMRNHIAHNHF